ncbi:MAG: hypothetical protein WC602_06440 [archaeon]
MAKLRKQGGEFVLKVSPSEEALLESAKEREFDLFRPKKGVFLLMEKSAAVEAEEKRRALASQVMELISRLQLENLVEGEFEKRLSKEQLQAFQELLKTGIVKKFKLSQKYRKAVYMVAETRKPEPKAHEAFAGQPAAEKSPVAENNSGAVQNEDYLALFDSKGYILTKSEQAAQLLSAKFREEIRHNEIRGMKNFDGEFCIIDAAVYEKLKPQLMGLFRQKKQAFLSEVHSALGIPKELAKIVCEIAKEDGELFEKKKELYCRVE